MSAALRLTGLYQKPAKTQDHQMNDHQKCNRGLSRYIYLLLLIVFLPFLSGCESRKTIVNGLDENDANEIIVFLSTKNIDVIKVPAASKEGGGGSKIQLWDISVPEEQSLEAMSYLNQIGLPRRRSQNLLGIFTGSGLVPSEMEQQIRYQAGLAEQIASVIRKFDGILDAEVQISFPKEDPLNPSGENKKKITASVYVKHNGVLDDPNSHLVTKIKRLVAASVAGLDYDNVTVIGEKARFSEYQSSIPQGQSDEEKQYVSVWSIILAKESVTRFRVIFFSFTLLILFLALMFAWVFWKIHPILRSRGGLRELFHLKPIQADIDMAQKKPSKEISKETSKQPSKEKDRNENDNEKSDDEESRTADKNIDQT